MTWLCLLLASLLGTSAGIMFTDGTVKGVFQVAFFITLGLSFVVLSTGMFDKR